MFKKYVEKRKEPDRVEALKWTGSLEDVQALNDMFHKPYKYLAGSQYFISKNARIEVRMHEMYWECWFVYHSSVGKTPVTVDDYIVKVADKVVVMNEGVFLSVFELEQ